MKRKKALIFIVSFLMLCTFFPRIIPTAQAQNPQRIWALIICGSEKGSFSNNTQYMYHVLNVHYNLDGIRYLDVYTDRPGVDALSSKTNVRSAITNWIGDRSDENDIIFIYFTSHGGGYHTANGWELGRVESSSDEGDEVRENNFRILNLNCPNPNRTSPANLGPWPLNSLVDWDGDGNDDDRIRDFDQDLIIEVDVDNDGSINYEYEYYEDLDGDGNFDDAFLDAYSNDRCDIFIDADPDWVIDGTDTNNDGLIVGVDLTGDGYTDDWVGIDECMHVYNGTYWDDELASDLDTLSYAKLIFVRQGCLEESAGCFGGGIIDDISAPKRIIMTATNETCYSYGDMDKPTDSEWPAGDGYSEWSEAFIDALQGQRTHYDNGVVHESPPVYVDADWSNDGHVSMWEAWNYAWENDEARLAGGETPWLDDNGNGLPTYRDEDDDLDQTDGLFSMETYFGFDNLKSPDVNDDGIIDILDIATIAKAYDSEPGDPNWNPDADLNNDDKVDIIDVAMAQKHFGKSYSDPPSSVSTKTILFTYPVWTVVPEGETFSVKVVLFNVDNLRGWEFKLYWNNAVLECTGADIRVPDFWSEHAVEAGPGVENDFNATHGRYWIAVSALHPAPPFNGSTMVATLTFKARASGSTTLDLQETKLAHNELYTIPHTTIDGSVIVRKR